MVKYINVEESRIKMKIINKRKTKKWSKLLPYLSLYIMCLTSCTSVTNANVSNNADSTIESQAEEDVIVSLPISEIEEQEETELNFQEECLDEPTTPNIQILEETEDEAVEERKLVALTFDDGPSKYTNELIEILNENDAHATFFLIGQNVSANSDAVINAYESGNEIAIHTYSHTSFTNMTIEEVLSEIDTTRSIIEELGVEPANLVRPPYGSINSELVENINASLILWNVDTEDWKSRDVESIKGEVYDAISEGDIILFHDAYPTTIEAIRELLPELSDEYEFVTVSELFNRQNVELENHVKYYRYK